MKKTTLILIIMLAAAVLTACSAVVTPAQEQTAPKDSAAEKPAEEVQEAPTISPEQFRDKVLIPLISYHPGTAGASLGRAQAAAAIMTFVTEQQLRHTAQAQMNQLAEDAAALLSDEEKGWLRENLPGMTALIDSAFSDYTEVSGVFADAGADSTMQSALAEEGAQEDWLRVRAALERLADGSAAE